MTPPYISSAIVLFFIRLCNMSSVHVLEVDHVLPRRPFPPPGDAVPLSLFDTYWSGLPPVQRLLLFPDIGSDVSFPALVQSLKTSLSEALHLFHPLTGKLTYLADSADLIIDCSPGAVGEGITFVVAESDIDISRLAGEATHDLPSFVKLVPELDVRELPSPVFAVKVTKFASGGVAVGYAVHHTVVDGKGVWRFLEAWAGACRGAPAVLPQCHDRAAIRHPRGSEISRRYMQIVTPDLPRITGRTSSLSQTRLQLTRRTFTLSSNTIKTLKQATTSSPPSTFIALAAHAWTCFAHAKDIHVSESTTLIFAADCRGRLDPPISDSYTGNCVRACYVSATGAELRGAGGLERACTAIKKAVADFLEEPLKGCEDWVDGYLKREKTRDMYVVGSPLFRAYDVDFGFGRPGRVELVSMNHDGEVVFWEGEGRGKFRFRWRFRLFIWMSFLLLLLLRLLLSDLCNPHFHHISPRLGMKVVM